MSNIYIKEVNPEEFIVIENDFQGKNFIQTGEFALMQRNRQLKKDYTCLTIHLDKKLVGGMVYGTQKRYKFFTEALVVHGPILDYSLEESVLTEIFKAIKDYFKKSKVSSLTVAPYIIAKRRDADLQLITDAENSGVIKAIKCAGFEHLGITSEIFPILNQLFIKDLEGIETEEDLLNSLDPKTKRAINKNLEYNVEIRELSYEEVPNFYEIEKSTSERKGFNLQELEYFQSVKREFGDKAVFIYTTMNFPEYIAKIQKTIDEIDEELEKYQAMEQRAKIARRVKTLKSDRNDFVTKLEKTKATNPEGKEILPLSSIMCYDVGDEIIYFAGGSYPEYLRFGGAASSIWHMLKYAVEKKKKIFNFYGTMEVDDAHSNTGNFNFKKQFGGQLVNLVGKFQVHYSPLFKVISKVKG